MTRLASVPLVAALSLAAAAAAGCNVVNDVPDTGPAGSADAAAESAPAPSLRDASGGVAAAEAGAPGGDAGGGAGGGAGGDDSAAASAFDGALPDAGAAVAVAAGYEHTCALASGGVYCWGSNASGQLGNGAASGSPVPAAVTGLGADAGVVAIAAGAFHTCALQAGAAGGGAAVVCWGRNDRGQLGSGDNAGRSAPAAVGGLGASVTAIAAGGLHTCALSADGAWCWGANDHGQLGDGETTSSAVARAVVGLGAGATAIAAGGAHTCAIAGGAVQCWGSGASGQLGAGSGDATAPAIVKTLAPSATAISAGNAHTCALASGGAAYCWGYGAFGQLGGGATGDTPAPAAVSFQGGGMLGLAAGGEHTCALDASGGAWCWGNDQSGQLGNDGAVDSAVPVRVASLASGATALAAGGAHACALVGGRVRCWGWNVAGQLGDGTSQDRAAPVAVLGF